MLEINNLAHPGYFPQDYYDLFKGDQTCFDWLYGFDATANKQAKKQAESKPTLTGKEAYEAQKALKRKRQQLEKKLPSLEQACQNLEALLLQTVDAGKKADLKAEYEQALMLWRKTQNELAALG